MPPFPSSRSSPPCHPFFFSSRRRHTRWPRDLSSDVCSSDLVDVIRRVRNRWRMKLALRGAVVVVAGTVLALLLSASGLEQFRFSAASIIAFRVIAVAVFVGLLCYGLIWPLRRRVTDAQVAMYL